MVIIKGYSIKWKRGRFFITLMGVTPRGKEKKIEIHFDPSELEGFIFRLKDALQKWKRGLPPSEEPKYIG